MQTQIPEFLLEMSKQINEQDNLCTADPVWQVRCKRTRPTASEYSRAWEIIDRSGDCNVVATNAVDKPINEQIVEFLDEDPDDLTVILESWVDANYDDGCQLTGQQKD